jgi:hypothetical protein
MAKAATSEKGSARDSMPLAEEYQTYVGHLAELLPQEGKFVLIHAADVAGVYETYKDALTAGYQKFGAEPFLVKRITAVELPVIVR